MSSSVGIMISQYGKNNPHVPKHQPVINHRRIFAKRCLPDCSWLRFPPNHTLELGSWEYKIGFLPSPHRGATPRLKFKSSVFSHFRSSIRIIIRSGKIHLTCFFETWIQILRKPSDVDTKWGFLLRLSYYSIRRFVPVEQRYGHAPNFKQSCIDLV